MIKEKLVTFEKNETDAVIEGIQSFIFTKDARRQFDFIIDGNTIFMTHPGGMVSSYWTARKISILSDLISELKDKCLLTFKNDKNHNNFISVSKIRVGDFEKYSKTWKKNSIK